MSEETQPRPVLAECQTRLTEMGIAIQVRTPTVICTFEFEADEDPALVLGLIASCPQVVMEQMRQITNEIEKEQA